MDSATVRHSLPESWWLHQSLPQSTRKAVASGIHQTVVDFICPPKFATIRQSPLLSSWIYKSAGLIKIRQGRLKSATKIRTNLRRTVLNYGGIWRTTADFPQSGLSPKRNLLKAEFGGLRLKCFFTLYWYPSHGPLRSTMVRHSPLQIWRNFLANCSWLRWIFQE